MHRRRRRRFDRRMLLCQNKKKFNNFAFCDQRVFIEKETERHGGGDGGGGGGGGGHMCSFRRVEEDTVKVTHLPTRRLSYHSVCVFAKLSTGEINKNLHYRQCQWNFFCLLFIISL